MGPAVLFRFVLHVLRPDAMGVLVSSRIIVNTKLSAGVFLNVPTNQTPCVVDRTNDNHAGDNVDECEQLN